MTETDTKTLVERLSKLAAEIRMVFGYAGAKTCTEAADRLISQAQRIAELLADKAAQQTRIQELESQDSISSRKIYE